jgi:phage portal protein BeeE
LANPNSIARKSASLVLGIGGYTGSLNNATFEKPAGEGYRDNAIVNACINRIANAVASIEPQLYQKKKGKLDKVETHDLLDLIESPNPAQSGKEFMHYLVAYFRRAGLPRIAP